MRKRPFNYSLSYTLAKNSVLVTLIVGSLNAGPMNEMVARKPWQLIQQELNSHVVLKQLLSDNQRKRSSLFFRAIHGTKWLKTPSQSSVAYDYNMQSFMPSIVNISLVIRF